MAMKSFGVTAAAGRRLVQSIVLSVLACASSGAWAAGEPLAKLSNGETVSDKDFETYLARRADLKPMARNFWGAESALREMLMTRVLVLEGLRMKEPNRGGSEPQRFDDTYGHGIYQKLVQNCPKPDGPAAARKFYDDHPEAFTVPASARLARIMLPTAEKVDGVPSMAWLMDQAQGIAKGSVKFEQAADKAAKLYRMEPQGDLGWVNLTGDVSIMKALGGAKAGEMVGPVRDGDFGYLFLIGEKRDPRVMKWDEVQASAANRQVVFCREQENKKLNEKLFKQYGVTFNNDAIKALFKIPPRPASGASAPPKVAK